MKAILKYPGSKWRIADWIISHMPTHRVYLEPFFGSGAVFFKKVPSYIETINDIDGNIVNLFRVCREHPGELARAINLTPFAREEFNGCYDMAVEDPVERARRTLVRFHQSFGSYNGHHNSWRHGRTSGDHRYALLWNRLPECVAEYCGRLKEAQIENVDAVHLIERYNNENTLIYCDPPYVANTRHGNLYAYEMDNKKHIELLEALRGSKSKIILSGYDNDLYNTYLADWNTAEKETTAQMGLHRVEKIWFNFEHQMQIGDESV